MGSALRGGENLGGGSPLRTEVPRSQEGPGLAQSLRLGLSAAVGFEQENFFSVTTAKGCFLVFKGDRFLGSHPYPPPPPASL